MIPKILHFVIPEPPTVSQRQAIAQARSLHPGWSVKVWTDRDNVQDARLAKYLTRARSGAQRADLIRLDAIFVHGGIYLDSDFRVLKALDDVADNYDFFGCSEDGYVLSNGALGAYARHPAAEAVISFLEDLEPNWSLPPNQSTGPMLFSKVLRWRPDVAILPRETFYPYLYDEIGKPPHRNSYAEHLWAASWKPQPATESRRRPLLASLRSAGKRAVRRALGHARLQMERARAASRPQNVLAAHPASSYPCASQLVVRTVHGHKLVLDGYDLSVSPDLAITGCGEWKKEAFVRRVLRGGDWFVDAGANAGVFSILAASLCGPFGRVLAFEPNDHLTRLLRKSAVANWYHDRIKIFGVALADIAGVQTLKYYPDRLGDGRVGALEKEGEPFKVTGEFLRESRAVEVQVCRLDDVIPVDLPIKLLKVDTDGQEIRVLHGAQRLLSKRVFDYIMLEAKTEVAVSRWHETVKGLKMLVDYGYSPASIESDGQLVRWSSIDEAIARRSGRTLVFYT